jgi:glycosyltransferase involved in cell wall biosynthesis
MSHTQTPLLSIVIPTYNRRAMLEEAIASFHGKLNCSYEVVIVDDGSTDNTWEYLQTLPSPPFKVIRQENSGSNAARNRGLKDAGGKYVRLLDSDDLTIPEQLDKQVVFLEENPSVFLCYSDWVYQTADEQRIMEPIDGTRIDEFIRFYAKIGHGCFTARTDLCKKVGYDLSVKRYQELDFFYGLLLHGQGKPQYLPGISSIYRIHGADQIQDSGNIKAWLEQLKILRKVETKLAESDMLTAERRERLAITYRALAESIYDFYPEMYNEILEGYVLGVCPDFYESRPYRKIAAHMLGYRREFRLVRFLKRITKPIQQSKS